MIFGIGTDIVKISRIQEMKSLSRFADKILSPEEHKIASSYKDEKLVTFLAKQFAGKEAISKAFGTGIREPILFKDIEILRDENGKPLLNALGGVKKTMINLGISKSHVSLADENDYAIAFAILEL